MQNLVGLDECFKNLRLCFTIFFFQGQDDNFSRRYF